MYFTMSINKFYLDTSQNFRDFVTKMFDYYML